MATKVNANVHFTNPDTGETVFVAAGETAPDWATVGDHLKGDNTDPDALATEPVAGPGQAGLTKRQAQELDAQLEANDEKSGADQSGQNRTSTSSNANAKKS